MLNVFNDGFIIVKREKKKDIDFTKKSKSKEYEELGRLSFHAETIRESDNTFIGDKVKGHTVSKKISVPYMRGIRLNDCVAYLTDADDRNEMYSIIWSDKNIKNRKLYLYLEKAGISYD